MDVGKIRNVAIALIASLVIVSIILGMRTYNQALSSPLIVANDLFCNTKVGFSSNVESNGYYPVGEKLYMWMRINVTTTKDLQNVKISDQLGAEWMMEGICVDSTRREKETKDPLHPENPGPMDYTLMYSVDSTSQSIIGSTVTVLDAGGTQVGGPITVDETSILTFQDITIHWSDESYSVHVTWNIGSLLANTSRTLFLVASTNVNAAGMQEFTAPGDYHLTSGLVVSALNGEGGQITTTLNSLTVSVRERD